MKNATKNIPRAIHASMSIVIVSPTGMRHCAMLLMIVWQTLFVLANVAYFVVLDKVIVFQAVRTVVS
jgi:hypothetical protein